MFNISFITALIKNNRFLILVSPIHCFMNCICLKTTMRNRRSGEVINFHTIMIAEQMMIRVILCDHLLNLIPIFYLVVEHKVIFIGKTPPDIRISCKSAESILNINRNFFHTQKCKSPSVIGMQ
ncbi:Uncharacterised protein [Dorea longicatena]|nr:Uncharacterised protein [Dorea longicatena]